MAKYVSWIDRVEKVLVGDIGLRLIIGVGVIQAAVGDYPPRLFFFEPYKIGDYSGMRRILDARVLSRVGCRFGCRFECGNRLRFNQGRRRGSRRGPLSRQGTFNKPILYYRLVRSRTQSLSRRQPTP